MILNIKLEKIYFLFKHIIILFMFQVIKFQNLFHSTVLFSVFNLLQIRFLRK